MLIDNLWKQSKLIIKNFKEKTCTKSACSDTWQKITVKPNSHWTILKIKKSWFCLPWFRLLYPNIHRVVGLRWYTCWGVDEKARDSCKKLQLPWNSSCVVLIEGEKERIRRRWGRACNRCGWVLGRDWMNEWMIHAYLWLWFLWAFIRDRKSNASFLDRENLTIFIYGEY